MTKSLFIISWFVLAGTAGVARSAAAAPCPVLGETLYSALLKTQAEPTQAGGPDTHVTRHVDKRTRYRIVIAANGKARSPLAEILREGEPGSECVAVCALKQWDRTPGETQFVDLLCQAPHAVPLASQATLFWPRGQQPGMLRFGTWLQGYSNVPLIVEMDRFTLPSRPVDHPTEKLARSGVQVSRLEGP